MIEPCGHTHSYEVTVICHKCDSSKTVTIKNRECKANDSSYSRGQDELKAVGCKECRGSINMYFFCTPSHSDHDYVTNSDCNPVLTIDVTNMDHKYAVVVI